MTELAPEHARGGRRATEAARGAGKAKAVPLAEQVRATKFEVVDGEGRVRGALGVREDGERCLSLLGQSGEAQAGLRLGNGGGSRLVLQAGAEPRLMVWLDEHGVPGVTLIASHRRVTAVIAVSRQGRPTPMLTDEQGEERWAAP